MGGACGVSAQYSVKTVWNAGRRTPAVVRRAVELKILCLVCVGHRWRERDIEGERHRRRKRERVFSSQWVQTWAHKGNKGDAAVMQRAVLKESADLRRGDINVAVLKHLYVGVNE